MMVFMVFSCQNTKTNKSEVTNGVPEIVEVKFHVNGMTCTHCEESIAKGVNELAGIEYVKASFADSVAIVKYDKSKTNETEIREKIKKRGYEVTGKL